MLHPRTLLFLSTLIALPLAAANIDGTLDPSYGTGGRAAFGFLESSSLQLRAMAPSPFARLWMFADDSNDRGALYVVRALADGAPDTSFGTNADGRRRVVVPASLIAQTEALTVRGALVQSDGKPLIFGGLRAVNGETGAFPGLVCRLAVAGNFDASFGTSGCQQLRSFINANETCLVEDVAVNADASLMVVGNCTGPSFAERPFIARLLSSGAFDFNYGAGAGLITPVIPQAIATGQHYQSIVARPDGRSVVLGHFATFNNTSTDIDIGVLQFDGGGSLDTSFSGDGVVLLRYSESGGSGDDLARDLILQENGKVTLLGQGTATSTGAPHAVALFGQLNADGSLDNSFGTNGKRIDAFNQTLSTTASFRSLAQDASGRLVIAGARSAGPTYAPDMPGTDFWMAFPPTVPPQADIQVLISGNEATSGYASNAARTIRYPFTVTPGLATRLLLPSADFEVENSSEGIESKSLHIVTNHPVTVQEVHGRIFALEGTTALPTSQLDRIYQIMSWGASADAASALVVAAPSNVTVTITPSISVNGRAAGVPFTVPLARGEVYHLRVDSPGQDLSGSRVVASDVVAVYGSNRCASVPNATIDFCDAIFEQMAPTPSWGSEFFVLPFALRTGGDIVRVFANFNGNTSVMLNGATVANLSPGGFYETSITSAVRITTTRPVTVAQYAKSCKADLDPFNCTGDPLMLSVPPTSNWASRYETVVPQLNANVSHFINVIAPASVVNEIYLNGQSVSPALFSPIAGTNFSGAKLPVLPGVRRITAPQPISAAVYGFRVGESYGYPAVAASTGEGANSDDLLVRYLPNGARDSNFGVNGQVLIDHSAAYGSPTPSFDRAQRVVIDGGNILVGSASNNTIADQQYLLSYRIAGGALFKNGFE